MRSSDARRRHHQPRLLVVKHPDPVCAEVHGHHGTLRQGGRAQRGSGWGGGGCGGGACSRVLDHGTGACMAIVDSSTASCRTSRQQAGLPGRCLAGWLRAARAVAGRQVSGCCTPHLGDEKDAHPRRHLCLQRRLCLLCLLAHLHPPWEDDLQLGAGWAARRSAAHCPRQHKHGAGAREEHSVRAQTAARHAPARATSSSLASGQTVGRSATALGRRR